MNKLGIIIVDLLELFGPRYWFDEKPHMSPLSRVAH